jgi:hypothetical protein
LKNSIALLITTFMLFLSCAHQQDLTPEEKEKYRKARIRYEQGQRGGP